MSKSRQRNPNQFEYAFGHGLLQNRAIVRDDNVRATTYDEAHSLFLNAPNVSKGTDIIVLGVLSDSDLIKCMLPNGNIVFIKARHLRFFRSETE